ncbi:grr1, plant, putative [Ricinus communis]|uniref:Grr1, plant, putative n=1 Tax=Ricinus communis TaxID=3988 RepID=B9SK24_RICCO|nr:grr1, plant, putative [Ricinus communis]
MRNMHKPPEVEPDHQVDVYSPSRKRSRINAPFVFNGKSYSRRFICKLSIRGSNSSCGDIVIGLRAIACSCPSLRAPSMCNLPSVNNEGIFEIAKACCMLEKLDIYGCPAISNNGLLAITKNCLILLI